MTSPFLCMYATSASHAASGRIPSLNQLGRDAALRFIARQRQMALACVPLCHYSHCLTLPAGAMITAVVFEATQARVVRLAPDPIEAHLYNTGIKEHLQGGWLEAVPHRKGTWSAYVDEEGVAKHLPENKLAQRVCAALGFRLDMGEYLLGPVVLTRLVHIEDDGFADATLSAEDVAAVKALVIAHGGAWQDLPV